MIPTRPPKTVAGKAMAMAGMVNLSEVFIVVLSLLRRSNARTVPRYSGSRKSLDPSY